MDRLYLHVFAVAIHVWCMFISFSWLAILHVVHYECELFIVYVLLP